MASFTVYKLHFTSPVHFGNGKGDYGISLQTIQSDTIYAAVTSCLAKMGIEIPADGDLGCAISSAFPFYQKCENSAPTYFFPKPLRFSIPKLKDIGNAKKVKKVRWLDAEYFRRVINGQTLFEGDNDVACIRHGEFLTCSEIPDFIRSEISARVTVPSRLGDEDAVPFYMDRVFFKDFSGLYFITVGECSLLEKGLELLQYEGIGTDRNVGNGYFKYEKDTVSFQLPDSSDYAMSLSMFIPSDADSIEDLLGKDGVSYDFARRGGWITDSRYSTIRKNVIYAFLPASVFAMNNAPCVKGKIVDLQPEALGEIIKKENLGGEPHPVWRCGKSIFIPIKL